MSDVAAACCCIGCQNGEPYCPCKMRALGVIKRDGKWVLPEKIIGDVEAGGKRADLEDYKKWLAKVEVNPDNQQEE